MIDRKHGLSLGRRAEVLGIGRASICDLPRPTSDADLALMRRIDELRLEHPLAGSRMLQGLSQAEGHKGGRLRVATLTRTMAIAAIDRRANPSKPAPGPKVYPDLPRSLAVVRPNQVWAVDISYLPMPRGFVCLAAAVEGFSRKVLAWRRSITLPAEGLASRRRKGRSPITDDRASPTPTRDRRSPAAGFIKLLRTPETAIGMDGQGAQAATTPSSSGPGGR